MAANANALIQHIRRLVGQRVPAPASDAALLGRFIKDRDEATFASLVARHGSMVLHVCRRVLGNAHDAEDAFQAVFLVLARKAGALRRRESLAAWLHGVARRVALNARAARQRRLRETQPLALSQPDPRADPLAEVSARELLTILDEEVGRLPEIYRLPVIFCCLEGRTQDEVARLLGWTPGSVKGRLERGRKRLHERLVRRGLSLAAALATAAVAKGVAQAGVPALLSAAAVRAGMAFAAGQTVQVGVSAEAIALAENLVKGMVMTKLKIAAAVALGTCVLATGAGLVARQVIAGPEPEAKQSEGPKSADQAREPRDQTPGQARADRHGDPLPEGAILRLGTVRFRQFDPGFDFLKGLAFLPDGKTLVTVGGSPPAVHFWETNTGRLLREIPLGNLSIRCSALSRDGKQAAVAGFLPDEGNRPTTGVVRILDTATGRQLQSIPCDSYEATPSSLAFSPDGKLLVSLTDTGAARITEVASATVFLEEKFPRDISKQVAMSADGAAIAIASGPNTRKLYVWQWQTGQGPGEFKAPQYGADHIALSPDGKVLTTVGRQGDLVRYEVESGRRLPALPVPQGMGTWGGLAFSPDGKMLALADTGADKGFSGGIDLWDLRSGKLVRRLSTPGESASGPIISTDSRWIAAGTNSGMHVWNLQTGEEISTDPEAHRGHIGQVAVAPPNAIATASDDHTVRVWEMTTGRQRLKLVHDNWVRAVAFSPDGSRLASSGLDDTVRLWDAQTGREIYRLAGHAQSGGTRALGFTPDGQRLLSWGDDFYLRVWDVTTGKAVREHAIRPSGVKVPDPNSEEDQRSHLQRIQMGLVEAALSPDGRMFLLGLAGTLFVFDTDTGKELRKLEANVEAFYRLAVSPDSKFLLAGGLGKQIYTKLSDGRTRFSKANEHDLVLWDLATGKVVRQATLPGSVSGPVAFSADRKQYAGVTSDSERRIVIWETATGAERSSISVGRGRVTTLAFTPDSRHLITALEDTTVLVWDLAGKH